MEVKVKKCDIGVMGLMSSEVDSAVGILVKGGVRWWDGRGGDGNNKYAVLECIVNGGE